MLEVSGIDAKVQSFSSLVQSYPYLLVLKPVLAAMRESPLRSYAEGCDRSIAYAVGWLVKEGRAAALQSIA